MPASMQPGELVVLTMTVPEAAKGVRLHAFGREIPVYRVDDDDLARAGRD